MLRLSSTAELVAALRGARDVSFASYTLPPGRVRDGLCAAARAGAHVRVRLEGFAYNDGAGLARANAAAVAALRAAGADAALVHASDGATDAMLHAKAAVVDGSLFLDDCNWPGGGGDTILRDDDARDAALTWEKRASLASEARMLAAAGPGDDVAVESESFGQGNGVFRALDRLARAGGQVRVLVCARDLARNVNERHALQKLCADGAAVRITDGAEKFAVLDGTYGWLGSANATAAFNRPDQLDWGARVEAPEIVAHLRQAFEARWETATVLREAT